MTLMDFHKVKEFSITQRISEDGSITIEVFVNTPRGSTKINLHTESREAFEIKWTANR